VTAELSGVGFDRYLARLDRDDIATGSTMLNEIERDIWVADGTSVPFFGFRYPTRMTFVRLADGSLWVFSPIALSSPLANTVNALRPRPSSGIAEQASSPFSEGLGAGVARRQALRLTRLSASPSRLDLCSQVG
jgi:hypothetical protein